MSDILRWPWRSAAGVSLVSGEEEGERVVRVDGDGEGATQALRDAAAAANPGAEDGEDGEEADVFRGMRLFSAELVLLAKSLQSL